MVSSQVRPLASPRPICPGKVSRGLAWPNTFLLPAGILRPAPGLCHLQHAPLSPHSLPGQPGLWPHLLRQEEREKAWLTLISDRF